MSIYPQFTNLLTTPVVDYNNLSCCSHFYQRLESSSGSSGISGRSISQSQEDQLATSAGAGHREQSGSTLTVPVTSTAIRASLSETGQRSLSAGSSEGSREGGGSGPGGGGQGNDSGNGSSSSKKNRFLLRRQDCLEKACGESERALTPSLLVAPGAAEVGRPGTPPPPPAAAAAERPQVAHSQHTITKQR